jgi:diacylglycerol kinase family enzyme
VLLHAPKLFAGTVAQVPGVSMTRTSTLGIASDAALVYHVDGEPHVGGQSVNARIHSRALRVMWNRHNVNGINR